MAMNTMGMVSTTSDMTAPEPATATIKPNVDAIEYAGAMLADDKIERSESPRTRARWVRFNSWYAAAAAGQRAPDAGLLDCHGGDVAKATSGSHPRNSARGWQVL